MKIQLFDIDLGRIQSHISQSLETRNSIDLETGNVLASMPIWSTLRDCSPELGLENASAQRFYEAIWNETNVFTLFDKLRETALKIITSLFGTENVRFYFRIFLIPTVSPQKNTKRDTKLFDFMIDRDSWPKLIFDYPKVDASKDVKKSEGWTTYSKSLKLTDKYFSDAQPWDVTYVANRKPDNLDIIEEVRSVILEKDMQPEEMIADITGYVGYRPYLQLSPKRL